MALTVGRDPEHRADLMGTRPLRMRPVFEIFQPAASYLASQACSVCRDTFHCAATSFTVRPSSITAKTA